MASIPVSLSEELRSVWAADAEGRGYTSLSAFVRDMVERGRVAPEAAMRPEVEPSTPGAKRTYAPDPKARPRPKRDKDD